MEPLDEHYLLALEKWSLTSSMLTYLIMRYPQSAFLLKQQVHTSADSLASNDDRPTSACFQFLNTVSGTNESLKHQSIPTWKKKWFYYLCSPFDSRGLSGVRAEFVLLMASSSSSLLLSVRQTHHLYHTDIL